jgi:hypothetical protein
LWERANANIETYPYNKEYSPNKANCPFIALSLRPNIAVIGANNGDNKYLSINNCVYTALKV